MYNSQKQLADGALPSVFVEELQECWRAGEGRRASVQRDTAARETRDRERDTRSVNAKGLRVVATHWG